MNTFVMEPISYTVLPSVLRAALYDAPVACYVLAFLVDCADHDAHGLFSLVHAINQDGVEIVRSRCQRRKVL